MPIVRTFGCGTCGHFMDVTLTMEQVDDEPPECPRCAQAQMAQEFRPVAIAGNAARTRDKAVSLAETIAAEDYGVADMQHDTRAHGTPKVRYKDQGNSMQQAAQSSWGAPGAALAEAMAKGRETRLANGGFSGVEVMAELNDLVSARRARGVEAGEFVAPHYGQVLRY